MPSVGLSPTQARKLDEARRVREMLTGKRMSRGVAIEALADFALQHRAEFGQWLAEKSTWAGHPLMDPNIGFDMGETDANTVDEVLYGKPRRR